MKHGFSEDFPRILGFSEIFFTIHGFSDNFDPQFSDSFLMHKKTLASFSGLKIAHTNTRVPTQTPEYPQEFSSSSPFQEDTRVLIILIF